MENKYEEKVRQRAEDFAKLWENDNIQHTDDDYLEGVVKECIPLARLSVQREAEAFIKANEAHYEGPVNMVRINEELQSLGLVPQKHKP